MKIGDIVRYFLRGYSEMGMVISIANDGVEILWFKTNKVSGASRIFLEVIND